MSWSKILKPASVWRAITWKIMKAPILLLEVQEKSGENFSS